MIKPPDLRWDLDDKIVTWGLRAPLEPISCEVVNLAVGQHTIKAVRWPDIKQDTAKRLLADYVLAAFEQYDIAHGKR